ncbi:hypothetical protein [Chitinophaga qingshengii]|uniref:Sulfatase-modifying factor enzyme domain-containing protein n=1 Tax=Chitinophaga qingshengii TaxID=1569794 RepID=A0ABR7THU8_9BACT|nr:hypothetical protein [Chitinophaga qingshengii]MBC9930019.1 hypothetical protein [Chitinophaga qingshengii]
MSVTQIYDRKTWNALPQAEAEAILQQLLRTQFPEFTVQRFETFHKFGQHTYTAILDYKGAEFVFVPGDTVVLGLESWNMTAETRDSIREMFGMGLGEIDDYIRERLSPVRTVTIGPMLVERRYQPTGYFPVDITDERLVSDDYFEKTFAEVKASSREQWNYTVNDSFRLIKNGDNITAFLYRPSSHEELLAEIENTGFQLPAEDEWEYLCGGGTRSFYPWGDAIDHHKKYRYFNPGDEGNYLETPNHFGLVIAYDPYRYEIMGQGDYFLKGGDGGCNLCGGGGLDVGYLSAGTYYRDPEIFADYLNYKEEVTGDYTVVRRIKRVK